MFEIADDTALLWSAALVALAALFCVVAYQAVFPPLGGCAGVCLVAAGRIVYQVAGRRWLRPEGGGGRRIAALHQLLAGDKAPGRVGLLLTGRSGRGRQRTATPGQDGLDAEKGGQV